MDMRRTWIFGLLACATLAFADSNNGELDKAGGSAQLVHIANEAQFYSLISQNNVIVDCYAPRCGPCKILAPIFESVAKEYGNVIFVKINIDQFPSIRDRFSIQSVPTILCFKKSKTPCRRVSKVLSKPDLRTMINQCFN